jgi:acetyltransferase-like isoleucine patch superfamily enzyme
MQAETADIDKRARIAESAQIWHLAQVRENAVIGENCIIGRGVYIDAGVRVGNNCKVQNNALIYAPAVLEDGVFVGPAVVFTNDAFPRAINADGSLKSASDWESRGVTVRRGAAIGARSVVLGGVEVGEWALVAAGSVVTRDVPAHALAVGSPARRLGWVGYSGRVLEADGDGLVDPGDGTRFAEVEGKLERR